MRRLWLIICGIGAMFSAEFADFRVLCMRSTVCAQDIVVSEAMTETMIVSTEKDKSISIWCKKSDTLRDSLLLLGDWRASVQSVVFPAPVAPTDADLEALYSLPNLHKVAIHSGHFVDDAIIIKLARLENLSELAVSICSMTNITGEGIETLGSYKRLKKLLIRGNFSGNDLAGLSKLEQLQELNLGLTLPIVSKKELAFLEKLTELRKLTLISGSHVTVDTGLVLSQFTDDSLSRLQNLDQLEELVIYCNSISGKELSHLSYLKSLRRLEIHRSSYCFIEDSLRPKGREFDEIRRSSKPLDDAGIEVLKSLHQLKSLDLCNTGITNVHSLQQALPGCQININWK